MSAPDPVNHRLACGHTSEVVTTRKTNGRTTYGALWCNRPAGHQGEHCHLTADAITLGRWGEDGKVLK